MKYIIYYVSTENFSVAGQNNAAGNVDALLFQIIVIGFPSVKDVHKSSSLN